MCAIHRWFQKKSWFWFVCTFLWISLIEILLDPLLGSTSIKSYKNLPFNSCVPSMITIRNVNFQAARKISAPWRRGLISLCGGNPPWRKKNRYGGNPLWWRPRSQSEIVNRVHNCERRCRFKIFQNEIVNAVHKFWAFCERRSQNCERRSQLWT